jgi:hypothetical protein
MQIRAFCAKGDVHNNNLQGGGRNLKMVITYWPRSGSTGKYPTEVFRYRPSDSEVDTARPRLEISPYCPNEVSKFFYYMALHVCKKWGKRHVRAKYKVRKFEKKNYKKCSWLVKLLYVQHFSLNANTVWIRGISSFNHRQQIWKQ